MQKQKWQQPQNLLLLEAWARHGLNEAEIAEKMGIAPATLADYESRYPAVRQALKRGKETADFEVESALFRKACGFSMTVKKEIKCKRTEFDPSTGKKMRETEELLPMEEEVYVSPDLSAQIFWLKNRQPEIWREKAETPVSGQSVVFLKGEDELEE